MIRRFVVELRVPEYPYGGSVVGVGRFRARSSARRRAERVLSRHARHVTRALPAQEYEIWDARIVDVRTGKPVETIDAPEFIVSSVGELGWAPI